MKSLAVLSLLALTVASQADSNIASESCLAYAANCGWLDARAGTGTHGAVIGEFVCGGFLYSANCGWIQLGNGTPANGVFYSNSTGADYGVNHLNAGQLRGLAWAANLGWLNFEDTGDPRVDLATGELSGHVWAANAGWISLAGLRVTHLPAGADVDADGIADAWELQHVPDLITLGSADADEDGASDLAEYYAGTDPLDSADALRITHLEMVPATDQAVLTWSSRPTRLYRIWQSTSLDTPPWSLSQPDQWILGGTGTTTTTSTTLSPSASNIRLFKVEARRPLDVFLQSDRPWDP